MGKFFGTWARILTKYNRILGIFFLFVYAFFAANLRNYAEFPKHKSLMYRWAPVGNPTYVNE